MAAEKNLLRTILEAYKKISRQMIEELSLFFILLIVFFIYTITFALTLFSDQMRHPSWLLDRPLAVYGAILFILVLFVVLAIAYFFAHQRQQTNKKILIIALLIFCQLAILSICIVKKQSEPGRWIAHDGMMQNEIAVNFLLQGKNPYQASYANSKMDDWGRDQIFNLSTAAGKHWQMINPALNSYVYMPLNFLLTLPVQIIFYKSGILYDNRLATFLFFIFTCWLAFHLSNIKANKVGLLVWISLSYFIYGHLIFGETDAIPTFFSLLCIYLLKNQHHKAAVLSITLAALAKQNMVFYWPFVLAYIFFKEKYRWNINSLKKFAQYPLIMLAASAIILLPFVLWCPSCFYHDTIYYLNHIYPIRGLGLSSWLLEFGIIKDPFQYYRFWIYQLIFAAIALPWFLTKQFKKNSLRQVYLYGTILMGGVWFLSRNFTFFHAEIIFSGIVIALFLPDENG